MLLIQNILLTWARCFTNLWYYSILYPESSNKSVILSFEAYIFRRLFKCEFAYFKWWRNQSIVPTDGFRFYWMSIVFVFSVRSQCNVENIHWMCVCELSHFEDWFALWFMWGSNMPTFEERTGAFYHTHKYSHIEQNLHLMNILIICNELEHVVIK